MSGSSPRVAYVLHRFPERTETFIARELYWVRRHGIEVDVFPLMASRHPGSSREAEALQSRIHYSRGVSWSLLRAHARFLTRRPGAYRRALANVIRRSYREPRVLAMALALFPRAVHIAAQIQDRAITHVHAHFVWLEGLAAGVVQDLTGATFSLHPHAFGLFGRNPRAVRAQLESAAHVVAISEYHRRFILALTPAVSGITLVHCGIASADFQPAVRRAPADPPRILSVGRAVEKKGHRYLIEACAALAERGREFTCSIVLGSEDGGRDLQRLIDAYSLGERIELLGPHDQDALAGRYRQSDMFALACVVAADGDRDGIPVSLMEAMASEVSVVTTPVAGIPELVRHEETGLLVPPRNSRALADALERLLADPELRHRLGKEGRRTIELGFEARDTSAQMAHLFRQLAAGS